MEPIIKIENLSKIYSKGSVAVGLHKVTAAFYSGEFVAITGSSGSGKSTLLNVLSCLDGFDEGDYKFNGESIAYFNEGDRAEFRKDYVSFVFQDYFLIDSYTVYRNIELALLDRITDSKERRRRVLEIIEEVGLKGKEKSRAVKLSGGEKQRVSIARAIAKDSPILFADEPTGNLDSTTTVDILELISRVSKGKLVFVVTHAVEELEKYATRKIRLADGEIVEDQFIEELSEAIELPQEDYSNLSDGEGAEVTSKPQDGTSFSNDSPIVDDLERNTDINSLDDNAKLDNAFNFAETCNALKPTSNEESLQVADDLSSHDSAQDPSMEANDSSDNSTVEKNRKVRNYLSKLIRVAYYNISSTPKKSIFTLSSLAILVTAFIWIFLISIGELQSQSFIDRGSLFGSKLYYKYDLQVSKMPEKGSVLTDEDYNLISSLDGVVECYPDNDILNSTAQVVIDGKTFECNLRDEHATEIILYKGRMPENANEVVITLPASRKYSTGSWIGKSVNIKIQDESGFYGYINLVGNFTICGVAFGDNSIVAIHSSYLHDNIAISGSVPPYEGSNSIMTVVVDKNTSIESVVDSLNEKGYLALYYYGKNPSTTLESVLTIFLLFGLLGVMAIIFRIVNGSIRTIEKTKRRDYSVLRTTGLDDSFIKSLYYVEMLELAIVGWIIGVVLSFIVLTVYGFILTPDIAYGFRLLKGYFGNIFKIIPLSLLAVLVITFGNAARFNRYFYKQTVKESLINA